MIISKTPYRISFFGGGTDYPAWYVNHKGAVLATSIDKYCHLFVREFPHFFSHKYQIVYSKTEKVSSVESINHPAAREVLRYLNIDKGVEINHMGDLPARAGLGTSSAYVVGLLNAMHTFNDERILKRKLSEEATHVERDLMNENVGSQDQITSSFGGFNIIEFSKNDFEITHLSIDSAELEKHLLLFFTGKTRVASHIAKKILENMPSREDQLTAIYKLVWQGIQSLKKSDFKEFGQLLGESWMLKKELATSISNRNIDVIYSLGMRNGAYGGKLLGAGGGGFLLFCAEPTKHKQIIRALGNLVHIPFKFEDYGSHIQVV